MPSWAAWCETGSKGRKRLRRQNKFKTFDSIQVRHFLATPVNLFFSLPGFVDQRGNVFKTLWLKKDAWVKV